MQERHHITIKKTSYYKAVKQVLSANNKSIEYKPHFSSSSHIYLGAMHLFKHYFITKKKARESHN